jgi:DNA-binding NarL/FixJ family response regulator
MKNIEQLNILVIDDHPVVLAGLQSLLNSYAAKGIIYTAANGEEALFSIEKNTIDVLLLDINLPDINGIDLCKKIKPLRPGIKILGMSTLGDYSHISRLIQNGADGYLLKNAPAEEIIAGIEAVIEGQKYFSSEVQSIISSHMFTSVNIPKLTRREREILEKIATGENNAQIAKSLFISPLTVDTHRKNLLSKFEVGNTVLLLKKARDLNLL